MHKGEKRQHYQSQSVHIQSIRAPPLLCCTVFPLLAILYNTWGFQELGLGCALRQALEILLERNSISFLVWENCNKLYSIFFLFIYCFLLLNHQSSNTYHIILSVWSRQHATQNTTSSHVHPHYRDSTSSTHSDCWRSYFSTQEKHKDQDFHFAPLWQVCWLSRCS